MHLENRDRTECLPKYPSNRIITARTLHWNTFTTLLRWRMIIMMRDNNDDNNNETMVTIITISISQVLFRHILQDRILRALHKFAI